MAAPLHLILIVLAIVLFLLAAVIPPWNEPSPAVPWRFKIVAAGLFFWCLSTIVTM